MKLLTQLQPHQVVAVEKLSKIKVGALYMEMGTGKTRTAIELAYRRFSKGKIDQVLWLCPCSVKETIRRELRKHISGFDDSFIVEGIESLSSSIRLNSRLLDLVKSKRIMLIVDESNLVKNHRAKRTSNIIRLSEYCPYRLILNGTPISKNEKDLYSQWYILDWRIFGYQSFWSFAANHLEYDENIRGKIRNVLNVDYLVSKMAPYTYQVRKDECLDLPGKSYSTYYYSLTTEQYNHYMATADELMLEVDEMLPHTIYRLFTGLQNVICGHQVGLDNEGKLRKRVMFENPLNNPRFQLLMDIIGRTDHKVIIFCKYTYEIETITRLLNEEYGRGTAVAFCGELNQRKRRANLKEFEGNAQFLVANKTCAGYGLNLQFCSYVIFYSNDWDYATRIQAEDRVHRMGQSENVHYVDICASDTLDERILKCLERKESLVESFKREIEAQKDIETIKRYVYYKDYKRRNKVKKIEEINIEALDSLKEAGHG